MTEQDDAELGLPPHVLLAGAVFPEALSPFSLRAFGVLYLSLGLAMVLLVGDRSVQRLVSPTSAGRSAPLVSRIPRDAVPVTTERYPPR